MLLESCLLTKLQPQIRACEPQIPPTIKSIAGPPFGLTVHLYESVWAVRWETEPRSNRKHIDHLRPSSHSGPTDGAYGCTGQRPEIECSNCLSDFRHIQATRGNSCRYQISMIPKFGHNIAHGFDHTTLFFEDHVFVPSVSHLAIKLGCL